MQFSDQHFPLIHLGRWPQKRLGLHFGRIPRLSNIGQFLLKTTPLLQRLRPSAVHPQALLLAWILEILLVMLYLVFVVILGWLLLIGVFGEGEGLLLLLLLEGLLQLACVEVDGDDVGIGFVVGGVGGGEEDGVAKEASVDWEFWWWRWF